MGGGGLPLTERLERAFADRVSDLPDATRLVLLVAALNDEDAVSEILRGRQRYRCSELSISTLLRLRSRQASSTSICRRSASAIRSFARRSRRARAWGASACP